MDINKIREGVTVNHSCIFNIDDVKQGLDISLYIAKSLNCESGGENPCNGCVSCRKIDNFGHADVQVENINKEEKTLLSEASLESVIKIDRIRELQKDIMLKPFEGRHKVYVLCHADRMTEQAQNCFLKVLEELPSKTTVILITRNIYKLLATVRSRCREINVYVERKYSYDYKSTADMLINATGGNVANLFNYAKDIAGDRDKLLIAIDFFIIFSRDIMAYRSGYRSFISNGIEDVLSRVSLNNAKELLGRLSYYRNLIDRSVNRDLIAINSLLEISKNIIVN